MKKLGMRVFWNHGPMPVTTRKNARLAMTVPFGTVMDIVRVKSVNGQTGAVELDAEDVGADPAGTAEALLNTTPDYAALIDAVWSI